MPCRQSGASLMRRRVHKIRKGTTVVSMEPTPGRPLDRLKHSYARRGCRLSNFRINDRDGGSRYEETHSAIASVPQENVDKQTTGQYVSRVPPIAPPQGGVTGRPRGKGVSHSDIAEVDSCFSRELVEHGYIYSPWEGLLRSVSPVKRDYCSPARSRESSRVRFSPENVVFEIPCHREFTHEEKVNIWSSPLSIRAQALRNKKEWVYEGCSFQNVVEEDKFFRDRDGNIHHPAHLRAKRA
jgi:hypothetical protein